MSPKIVGIIMAFQSAEMLERTYQKIPKERFHDLILVDDGSTDTTREIAERLGIRTFAHAHLGYGGNIKFGLKKALEMGAEYLVEIHGDGQYDMGVVASAIRTMEAGGHDFLLGSRFTTLHQALKDGMSFIRYAANRGLSFFDRLILRVPLTEFHSGFRVYSRRLLETIGFEGTSNDYLYSFEIIAQAQFHGLSLAEIPVRCNYRDQHTSISMRKSVVYVLQTFRVLFLYLLAKMGFRTRLFVRS